MRETFDDMHHRTFTLGLNADPETFLYATVMFLEEVMTYARAVVPTQKLMQYS